MPLPAHPPQPPPRQALAAVVSRSPDETFALGRRLGERLVAGAIVALEGELGSGKTLFTKGLASGLGVARHERVNSPTFVIMQEYAGRHPIRHYDTYRLDGPRELLAAGFEDDLAGGGRVVVIEWADRVREVVPPAALTVTLEHVPPADGAGDCARRLMFSGDAALWADALDFLKI